jgi:hypothetical protein
MSVGGEAEGTTFQAVLTGTREHLARHYLTHSAMTSAEIAYLPARLRHQLLLPGLPRHRPDRQHQPRCSRALKPDGRRARKASFLDESFSRRVGVPHEPRARRGGRQSQSVIGATEALHRWTILRWADAQRRVAV